MTSQAKVEIKIPNKSEYVGVVRLAVAGIANRMNFTIEDIEDIKIAVSEACANAVRYAYPNDILGYIDVTCLPQKDKLEITVKDSGIGFDPKNIHKSKVKKETSQASKSDNLGLGFVFMQSLMDKVDLSSSPNKGTTVHLVKKVPVLSTKSKT